jgi:hypothetical protein
MKSFQQYITEKKQSFLRGVKYRGKKPERVGVVPLRKDQSPDRLNGNY